RRTDPNSGLGIVDLEPLKPEVLAVRTIPRADEQLAAQWKLPEGKRAVGLITCTSDDALYVALDEGTKAAPVEVVYARSFYAGASYPSGPLSGEAIGVYAAEDQTRSRPRWLPAWPRLRRRPGSTPPTRRGSWPFFRTWCG